MIQQIKLKKSRQKKYSAGNYKLNHKLINYLNLSCKIFDKKIILLNRVDVEKMLVLVYLLMPIHVNLKYDISSLI